MCEKCPKASSLDTLAQPRKVGKKGDPIDLFPKLLKGTAGKDFRKLKKRAKRKSITHEMVLKLIQYCDKHKGEDELKKAYWNTYYCAEKLLKKNSKIFSAYCKNRWCLVCNSIRQAVLIKKYTPVMDEWSGKYFVTLTVPNCSAKDLDKTMDKMYKTFTLIKDKFRKRFDAKTMEKFVGLRKLECTYNSKRNDYHPHFHLVVSGEGVANELVKSWLKENPKCKEKAQDCRKATEGLANELFKYITKISTSKDSEKQMPSHALNTIFRALKGRRAFQNFGFQIPKTKKEDIEDEEVIRLGDVAKSIDEVEVFNWEQEAGDWVNRETGEILVSGLEIEFETSNSNLETLPDDPKKNIPEIPI